eukprot:SAG31_NODE_1944_length_6856_cov_3.850969_10_plen_82_part_00
MVLSLLVSSFYARTKRLRLGYSTPLQVEQWLSPETGGTHPSAEVRDLKMFNNCFELFHLSICAIFRHQNVAFDMAGTLYKG